MKKITQFTLSFFTLMIIGYGSSFAQWTGGGLGNNNGCYNPKQVCRDCMCLMVYDPVCGCNDVTYSNSCFAYISGITSWTEGACGSNANASVDQPRQLFFRSPVDQEILMEILNESGEVVATPMECTAEAGMEYLITPELPAGNYVCRVSTPNEVQTEAFSIQ